MISSVLPTYNRVPLSFEKGEGAWLVTADGTRYLDFISGIAVNALGHCHPKMVENLAAQAQKLWHISNLFDIPEQQKLADMLTSRCFADTVFFTNSGTEAAELAIKMVRKYWHEKGQDRHKILSFEGAFHGRSTGAIAMAASEKMTKGFGPLMPGFEALPFGDHEALTAALDETVAAVIIEPVQGEGGIRPVPVSCLDALRKACDAVGALLVYDEVQCGMGRTGRLFAYEWTDHAPDILMTAKGIGGGMPLGAVLATEAAAVGMGLGTHGSTYGGNPLACSAGITVLETFDEEDVLKNVMARGDELQTALMGIVQSFPGALESVRGMGLMQGVVCKIPCGEVVAAAREQGLLLVAASDNAVRLLPPLTVNAEEIEMAASKLRAALRALSA